MNQNTNQTRLDYFLLLSWSFYALALPLSMSATNIALGLALALTLLKIIRNRKNHHFFSIPLLPFSFLFLFFFWTSATLYFVHHLPLNFSVFGKIWNLLPLCLLPAAALSANDVRQLLKISAATAAIVVILGGIQYAFGIHYFWEIWTKDQFIEQRRFIGFQSHPLHAAALYSVLCLGSFSLALDALNTKNDAKNDEKFQWFFLAFILAVGVCLNASRSYYVGLLAGIFYLLFRKSWKALALGILVFGIFYGAIKHSSSYINERITTMVPSQTDESGRQRLFMWQAAKNIILDHPVCGIGYRQWKNYVLEYLQKIPNWTLVDDAIFAHAHNSYLTVAAETGIVGLALFLLFWIALLRQFLKNRSALGQGAVAVILALMFAAVFEHNLMTATVCLSAFFLFGLAQSLENAE